MPSPSASTVSAPGRGPPSFLSFEKRVTCAHRPVQRTWWALGATPWKPGSSSRSSEVPLQACYLYCVLQMQGPAETALATADLSAADHRSKGLAAQPQPVSPWMPELMKQVGRSGSIPRTQQTAPEPLLGRPRDLLKRMSGPVAARPWPHRIGSGSQGEQGSQELRAAALLLVFVSVFLFAPVSVFARHFNVGLSGHLKFQDNCRRSDGERTARCRPPNPESLLVDRWP